MNKGFFWDPSFRIKSYRWVVAPMILVSVPVPLTLIDKPKSKVKVSKKSQDLGYL